MINFLIKLCRLPCGLVAGVGVTVGFLVTVVIPLGLFLPLAFVYMALLYRRQDMQNTWVFHWPFLPKLMKLQRGIWHWVLTPDLGRPLPPFSPLRKREPFPRLLITGLPPAPAERERTGGVPRPQDQQAAGQSRS